jgi:hypothetical protein
MRAGAAELAFSILEEPVKKGQTHDTFTEKLE